MGCGWVIWNMYGHTCAHVWAHVRTCAHAGTLWAPTVLPVTVINANAPMHDSFSGSKFVVGLIAIVQLQSHGTVAVRRSGRPDPRRVQRRRESHLRPS